MIHFLDSMNEHITQDYDVCIIGSGVAAFSLLSKFIHNKNLKIAVLESSTHWNERIHLGSNPYSSYAPEQTIYEGELCGWINHRSPDYLVNSRIRTFGGTSHSGWIWPLDKIDFDNRKFHGGISWPLSYDEMNLFYEEACKLYRLDNNNFSSAKEYVNTIKYKTLGLLELEDSDLTTKILKFNPYYLHYYYNDAISNSENIHIFRNANCLGFDTTNTLDESYKVSTTYAQTLQNGSPGKIIKFRANHFILAAGALETTRLLLLNDNFSKNKELGRNFLEHPYLWVAAKFNLQNVPNDVRNFYFCNSPIITNNNIGIVPSLVPHPAFIESKNIGNFRILLGGGTGIPGTLNISWEQAPNRESLVTLSDTSETDIFGQKRLKVDHALSDIDKTTVKEAITSGYEVLHQLGFADDWVLPDNDIDPLSWTEPGFIVPGNHAMGTTRMSLDRTNGVVDVNCKLHDAQNLFIASSSVFPTGGYANPNLTISALSLRLADHISSL